MKFRDIEKFPHSHYHVHVELGYLKSHLDNWGERGKELPNNYLEMNPDFQRGHVWTEKQKIAFMEYFLRGGKTGREVYFNCSSWQDEYNTPIFCLDGLQRITAALDFLDDKIKVFGAYRSEYEDNIRLSEASFSFHVLKIKKKKDLLKVYLDLNSGGTPHDPKEIARVTKMFESVSEDETI